jgi:hypothetical protein
MEATVGGAQDRSMRRRCPCGGRPPRGQGPRPGTLATTGTSSPPPPVPPLASSSSNSSAAAAAAAAAAVTDGAVDARNGCDGSGYPWLGLALPGVRLVTGTTILAVIDYCYDCKRTW